MNGIKYTSLSIVIIGAINWGAMGFFGFDIVTVIFGGQDVSIARFIYCLIGISGIVSSALLADLIVVDTRSKERILAKEQLNYLTEFSEEIDLSNLDQQLSEDEKSKNKKIT